MTSPILLSINCLTCSAGQMLDASYTWSITIYNNVSQQFDNVPDSNSYFLESGKLCQINENPVHRFLSLSFVFICVSIVDVSHQYLTLGVKYPRVHFISICIMIM